MVSAAYSTITTTYDCPKSLCFKELIISGPYGDPTEKIDSSVPHLGGDTYENIYNNHYGLASKMNDYHLYIVYCPKYDNSDSSLLRHTMTLMFCKHGYTTKSYTQYNASQHYANKACDHATDIRGSNIYGLTQHLCGENAYLEDTTMEEIAIAYQSQTGCGKETAVLENHTWVYGSWYKNGDNYHSRTKTCSDCGYSTVVSDVHSLTEGDWVNSSSTQHKKTTTCSVCDYSKTSYANHSLTTSDPIRYGTEDANESTYPHDEFHKYEKSIPLKLPSLNLMYTIVVPLVFFTISSSIANMVNLRRLGKILKYVFIVFVITSLISSVFMLFGLSFFDFNVVFVFNIFNVEC